MWFNGPVLPKSVCQTHDRVSDLSPSPPLIPHSIPAPSLTESNPTRPTPYESTHSMEQKFEGTPQAEIKLEGHKLIRSDVTNDWGFAVQWLIKRDGQSSPT